MKASVIGAGSFGTAVADLLGSNFDDVGLWARDGALAESIARTRQNAAYLPGITLCQAVRPTGSLEQALAGTELVVAATPSHAAREVMSRAAPLIPPRVPIVTVSKGIE